MASRETAITLNISLFSCAKIQMSSDESPSRIRLFYVYAGPRAGKLTLVRRLTPRKRCMSALAQLFGSIPVLLPPRKW